MSEEKTEPIMTNRERTIVFNLEAKMVAEKWPMHLARGFLRYEIVRRMHPQKFAELFRENLATGIPFDDLIDRELLNAKGKTK